MSSRLRWSPRGTQAAAAVARRSHRLRVASVLGGFGLSLAGSAGALLAGQVSGHDSVAGLPQAVLVVGSAGSALALSRLATRWGRNASLAAGAAGAALGSVVVVIGAEVQSLPTVLFGSLALGAGNASVMLGRYAAAEMVPEGDRARAMASVLAAITIGAVAGPNLLAASSAAAHRFGFTGLAGPYLVAAAAFVVAAVVLHDRREPNDVTPRSGRSPVGPLLLGTFAVRSAWSRRSVAGLAMLSVANLVMVGVMTMAPVELHQMNRGLSVIGLVVSVHIAGMFAPSPFSGWLTDRIGPARTAALAGAVLVTACGWATAATSTIALAGAMITLGLGWNLALLCGSALLTADSAPKERPNREGWGEVGMGAAASGAGISSGVVMSTGGYSLVAMCGAVMSVAVLPMAWLGRGRSVVTSNERPAERNDHD